MRHLKNYPRTNPHLLQWAVQAQSFRKMIEVENDLEIIRAVTRISGKRVIDVGCGSGELVRSLAGNGAAVTGIDSSEILKKAREFPQIKDEVYLAGGGEILPLEMDCADIVLFFASLHHVPEPFMKRALKETHRVLKNEGMVIILEPMPENGSYFELIRLVDDETPRLKSAYNAIRHACKVGFRQEGEELVYSQRSFTDFLELLEKYVDNKEEREGYLARAEEAVERMSREAGMSITDYRFKSIARVNVLRKN